MKRTGKNKSDEAFLKAVGSKIAEVIEEKGYNSPYDFWIKKCDGQFTRATLGRVISGKVDARLSTIRTIAKLLRVHPKVFLETESD